MSFIGNMLGLGSGGQWAPKQAPLQTPVSVGQAQNAYGQAQNGLAQQQAFLDALSAQNGIGNQNSVYNQLQGVANGAGPNPAQAMLNQATGNNIQAQSALMASQRGAGANPALLARQAAQQGASTQQNAIGQGATLQANQSLNALNQLGGLANQQVAQKQGALNAYNTGAQGQQGQLLGAIGAQNNAAVGAQNNINDVNAKLGGINAQGVGGLLGGIGSATGLLAEGGAVEAAPKVSHVMNYLMGKPAMAHGGKVPALVSPGEKYLPPSEVEKVAKGKKSAIKAGETIPGKPKVGGAKNSYSNDTVSKTLDEGGIVLPRSVTQSKDPAKAAHAFVSAIVARHGMKKGK